MSLSRIAIFVVLAAIPAAAQSGDLAKKSHEASELMAAGKFDQAIPIYRELVRAIPNNPGFALNLGLALHMAGRDPEAIPPLQTALKHDPELFPANLFLGAAFLGAGEPERAMPPLAKACKTQPANPDAQQMLAAALLSLDRFKEAAEHYKRLSELLPQNPKAWAGLVQCYQALAQSEFEKLGRTPRDSGYWFALMAEARAKSQQFKSAFYLYRQALGRTPELRGVHAAVAEIYRKSDHPDWAVLEDKKERELPAPNCTVKEAECDFFAGHYAEAAMAAAPTDGPEAYYWRTKAYNSLANEAYARLKQLPPSAEAHEQAAMLCRSQGKHREEIDEWQAALKFAPNDAQIETQLAFALNQFGDHEAARTVLQGLIKKSPESVMVNYLLGDTLSKLHQPTEAIPRLEKAVTQDPHLLAAQSSLARAYLQVGEGAKAIPHLEAALPTDEDGSLHYQLARAYSSSGQQELAQRVLREYQAIQEAKQAELISVDKEVSITAPTQ